MQFLIKAQITTINELYKKEIRILHTPLNFFKELGIVIDDIDSTHEIVRRARQETWRTNNQTRKTYNLFMDNTTQTMSYAVFRWGVPLAVPLILSKENPDYDEVLLDYLERDDSDCGFPSSAEMMTRKIKDHKKYGLGKAIGDKAAHLFAKWMVYSFRLTRVQAKSWSKYSYEIPFDSNAGRVLFRTGFYLNFLHEDEMKVKSVIQPNAGKNGKHYLRITNSRGLKVTKNLDDLDMKRYSNLCVNYLKTHKRKPGKIEIQRVPILLLLHDAKYGVGEFDDGLMHIGTHYCFNVETPNCEECPLKDYCQGYNDNRDLIKDYRT